MRMAFLSELKNTVLFEVAQDVGDFVLVNISLPESLAITEVDTFRFPKSLLIPALQNCDPDELVEMIGEDYLISGITLEGITRVFTMAEILSAFNVDDDDFTEETLKDHGISDEIFSNSFIWWLADKRGILTDWAGEEGLMTSEDFWQDVDAGDVLEVFGADTMLSCISREEAVEYYDLETILDDYPAREIIDIIGVDNVIGEITVKEVAKNIDNCDLAGALDLEDIIDEVGEAALLDEFGLECVADVAGPEIMKFFTAEEIAKYVGVEKLVEAIELQREMI